MKILFLYSTQFFFSYSLFLCFTYLLLHFYLFFSFHILLNFLFPLFLFVTYFLLHFSLVFKKIRVVLNEIIDFCNLHQIVESRQRKMYQSGAVLWASAEFWIPGIDFHSTPIVQLPTLLPPSLLTDGIHLLLSRLISLDFCFDFQSLKACFMGNFFEDIFFPLILL